MDEAPLPPIGGKLRFLWCIGNQPAGAEILFGSVPDEVEQGERMRLLKLREVRDKTGLGTTSIYRRMAEGSFPRPVTQSRDLTGKPRTVAWVESEIDDWIENLVEESRAKPV